MITRRPRFQAARAGGVCGEDAADCAPARNTAKQRAVIHRLEGELLAFALEKGFDLGDGGSGER